ncbi:putative nuclease HARBI1 [Ischnura elegans]|uniref:putative nuclease HARBI1 n=1 Tax=Ischnura elegans TaxID=197161 RepID=UPI001ED87195|nr:putative nuclease HARBI1 [Ischnura elegans]
MDGKHILFQPPASAGSYYFNYKGGHSIVLLAVADANYRFIYVDVGVNGRVSDGGVFRESSLAAAIARNLLQFPANETLPGRDMDVPYVFVADDAFPLTERIMKPFPFRGLTAERRRYNYHLSRARRVVENAFGILCNRFRVLLTTINLAPEKVEVVTLAAVTLHNFLCGRNVPTPNVEDFNALPGLPQQGGNRPGNLAFNIRSEFSNYFNSLAE